MTRLIDADVFEKKLEDEWILHEISNKSLGQIGRWLAQQKTIDAVPVIRCKDCKHCRNYCRIVEDVEYKYVCELKEESGYPYGRFRVHEDDYCSWAERRKE